MGLWAPENESTEDRNMVVSTKGRYALRVMIDLAKYGKDAYVSLGDIASRQNLSEPAEEITAWDIISITENDFYVVSCMSPDAPKCERIDSCVTLPMWKEFSKEMQAFFKRYTIAELAEKDK